MNKQLAAEEIAATRRNILFVAVVLIALLASSLPFISPSNDLSVSLLKLTSWVDAVIATVAATCAYTLKYIGTVPKQ
ncbi:MAG: hypothetical protein MHM6MM_006853 [Cercozoa sp. M6MM]